MADTPKPDLVHTTNEMKPDIVCPLSLKIAIASKGALGAIQSYRCAPRPNSGGWETRPQPKTDKWTEDFFRVLHGPKGQPVTLTDGETVVNGLGFDEDTKSFHFRHEDGVMAKKLAIQRVKAGELRATRNWDKVFAPTAGITKEELESTYSALYKPTSRASNGGNRSNGNDQEIEALGEGFFGDEAETGNGEGEAHVEPEALGEDDEQAIAEEEASWEREGSEEPTFSVMAELGLDEETAEDSTDSTEGTQIAIKAPPSGLIMTIHTGCEAVRLETTSGNFLTLYRVRDPETGKSMFLEEGWNADLSDYYLEVID